MTPAQKILATFVKAEPEITLGKVLKTITSVTTEDASWEMDQYFDDKNARSPAKQWTDKNGILLIEPTIKGASRGHVPDSAAELVRKTKVAFQDLGFNVRVRYDPTGRSRGAYWASFRIKL